MISTAVQQSANVSASGRGAPARDILGGTFPATAQRENQPAEIPQERRNARQPDHRVDQHASHGRYAACLLAWARVGVTSNIVADKLLLFSPSFPASILRDERRGRSSARPRLLGVHSRPGNDACAATRQGDCRGRLPGPGSTDASGGGHPWAGIARCPASPSARRSGNPRRALDGRFACPRVRPRR